MPKVAKNYKKYWKDYLVECLKLSADTISKNAKEIVGNYKFTGKLEITISMPTDFTEGKLPEIVVNKVYFPDYDKHYEAYRAMQEKLKLDIREDVKRD